MGIFSDWILKIVGVVVLGVLIDIILPEGQTNKYIKSILAIVTILVIISPLPKLLNMNVEEYFITQETQEGDYIDSDFIEFFNNKQAEQTQNAIKTKLEENKYKCNNVKVDYQSATDKFLIKKIKIELNKKGINWEISHIDIISKVKQLVKSVINIDGGCIEVNAG